MLTFVLGLLPYLGVLLLGVFLGLMAGAYMAREDLRAATASGSLAPGGPSGSERVEPVPSPSVRG